jgi:transposase
MRKGFDGLLAIVVQELGQDVQGGDVFLFLGRRRRRAKVLYFDGTGLCLLSKRLEKGLFAKLHCDAGPLRLTLSELSLFLEGCALVGKLALSPPVLEKEELAIAARM